MHRLSDNSPVMVLDVRVMAGSGGGPEKTILRSPRHLDPARYAMAAAYIHPRGDRGVDALRRQAHELGCELRTIPEAGPLDPRTPAALLKLCRKLRVRIWHGHDYKSNLLGLLIARLHPMRLITTLHGWTDETCRMRLYRRLDELAIRHYHRVLAVSQPIAQRSADFGVPPRRLSVVPNGIELSEFTRRQTVAQARAALGLDPRRVVVGIVGRLSHEKGVDRLIEPLREVAQRIPHLLALLIGDGPERARLEAAVHTAGLSEHVRFCGWQRPLHAWYEAMDALVLPSRTEGVPNVVLEAMALQVPVAATAVGGVPDLLDSGGCGLLLGEDPATWATPLAHLLKNKIERRRFATLAHERVAAHYSFAQRMRTMMAIYDELLETADRHTGAPLHSAA